MLAILLLAIVIDAQFARTDDLFSGFSADDRAPRTSSTLVALKPVAPQPNDAIEPHGPVIKGDPASWITPDDYPAEALAREQQGKVSLLLHIDEGGGVSDCQIAKSSGVAILDETTCRLARTRMHFFPARDADGGAIAATWQRNVVWQLP